MSKLVITVGLSGVGKSTVIEEALKHTSKDSERINYGDEMLGRTKERDLVEKRDEMKNIEPETYKELQEDAAEEIRSKADSENVLVDTHAAIKTPYGYIPGLPKWSIEMLDPDTIVMLEADPEEVARRRSEDETRDRRDDEVEELREYQMIARNMAGTDAVLTGSYLKVIQNERNQAEQAAEELRDILIE